MIDIDSNSREFEIGKKIGHLVMSYIIVRLVIKGTKTIFKYFVLWNYGLKMGVFSDAEKR